MQSLTHLCPKIGRKRRVTVTEDLSGDAMKLYESHQKNVRNLQWVNELSARYQMGLFEEIVHECHDAVDSSYPCWHTGNIIYPHALPVAL